ncbi:MAG: tRNA (guanosine(37)-N1)-methyltransferase TrmD [Lachnospiraceae bacterium]|nr:tRNA (guanosine(37)-N1)-methyltransferase TrmD [Lachnospiraceae bacterium]
MRFHVLTLFPELIENTFGTSITGRGLESGKLALHTVNIRDYADNRHHKVDDSPYGGGAGLVMQAEPVYRAWESVRRECAGAPRVIYVTPQGHTFRQELARELAREEELIFLCGHYEGIDERVLKEIVTDYISIGDYVLTGGELAALVMMDAIARLVPGVLHNQESAEFESFHNSLLEYPQYSRPETWHEKQVPRELLSGNHKEIEDWRLEQAKKRTRERRPDLYEEYERRQACERQLMKQKLLHTDMLESLRADRGRILHFEEESVALADCEGIFYVTAKDPEAGEKILEKISNNKQKPALLVLHQEFLVERARKLLGPLACERRFPYVYTQKHPLPRCYGAEIRPLTELEDQEREDVAKLVQESGCGQRKKEAFLACFRKGRVYGAFVEGRLRGFMGQNQAGDLDFLYVGELWRRRGIGRALETAWVNQLLGQGARPFVWVEEGEESSRLFQESLGLCRAKSPVWILAKP